MDQLDIANHDTAHRSGVDIARLADQMGVGYQVLINKVNWSTEQNKLTQREALAMQLVTNTRHIIREECRILGGEFVQREDSDRLDVTTAVLQSAAEHGDVGRTISDALGDGVITVREEAEIKKQITEAREALAQLMLAIQGKNRGPGSVQTIN